MKKTMTVCLLFSMALFAAVTNPLHAQNAEKDMAALIKKFQDTYNKADAKGLKMMYTDDAVQIDADGQSLSGNTAISDEFAKMFANSKLLIEIKSDKATTNADGSVTSTGSYHVTGTSNSGDKIDNSGNYNNTVIKSGGHWKIAKSVKTNM